jgi:protein phosphatase
VRSQVACMLDFATTIINLSIKDKGIQTMGNEVSLLHAGATHVGMKRTLNEDSIGMLPESGLFLVADGMGGHSSGEVASKLAIDTILEFFQETDKDPEKTWPFKEDKTYHYAHNRLITAIKLANLRVFETAKSNEQLHGMGTTLVAAYFHSTSIYIAHVGDSRAYVFRQAKLTQITQDHSLLNDYLKIHSLSSEEIQQFPHKNVIVRALGMKDHVLVDVVRYDRLAGDRFMLCSDGLSGMLTEEQLSKTIEQTQNLSACCDSLIHQANQAGGSDNISVIVIQV